MHCHFLLAALIASIEIVSAIPVSHSSQDLIKRTDIALRSRSNDLIVLHTRASWTCPTLKQFMNSPGEGAKILFNNRVGDFMRHMTPETAATYVNSQDASLLLYHMANRPIFSISFCSTVLWLADGGDSLDAILHPSGEAAKSHTPSYLFITAGVIALYTHTVSIAHAVHVKPAQDAEAGTALQIPGPKGDKGDKGEKGEKGEKGDKGDVYVCELPDKNHPGKGPGPIPEIKKPVPGKADGEPPAENLARKK